jgi:hypothetical protein
MIIIIRERQRFEKDPAAFSLSVDKREERLGGDQVPCRRVDDLGLGWKRRPAGKIQ